MEELIPTNLGTVNDFALNTSSLETVLYRVNGSHLSVSGPDPGDMETVSRRYCYALHVGCSCLHVYVCTYMYVQLQCIVHVMCLVCMCIRMYVCTLLYVGDVMHLRTCVHKWNESIHT